MREDSTRRRAHIEALLAFVVPILLLAPFANKAYHIDDPLSLWTAQHILQDPIRFFDYEVNWTGVPGSASIIIKNPPLAMYYMALVGAVAGWGEAPMHLAFFLFAGLTGFGAYLLARRFCSDPLLAAGIAVLSPAVLVSASNVMTTIAMVALYVLAIEAWLRALDTNRAAWYVAAASLIIASTLAKYFGISAVPLLFAYTLAKQRRLGGWAAWLAVPVVVILGYDLWTRSLFGIGLFLDAGNYARYYRASEGTPLMYKSLVGLAYTGACVIAPFFYAPLFNRRWPLLACILTLAVGAIVYLAWESVILTGVQSPLSLSRVSGSAHFAVFAGAGVFVLALATYDLAKARTADALLLFLWVMGTFVFAAIVNWTLNARSLMPMAIPAAILVVRELDRTGALRAPARRWIPLLPVAALTMTLVYADFRLANTARSAAHYFGTHYVQEDKNLWFQGHWGWQYYIEQYGASHIDSTGTTVQPDDVIVAADNNMRSFPIPPVYGETEVTTWTVFPWLTTWNYHRGGGYYANTWGPLPYVFGVVPPEQYVAYRVNRPARVHDPDIVAFQESLPRQTP